MTDKKKEMVRALMKRDIDPDMFFNAFLAEALKAKKEGGRELRGEDISGPKAKAEELKKKFIAETEADYAKILTADDLAVIHIFFAGRSYKKYDLAMKKMFRRLHAVRREMGLDSG